MWRVSSFCFFLPYLLADCRLVDSRSCYRLFRSNGAVESLCGPNLWLKSYCLPALRQTPCCRQYLRSSFCVLLPSPFIAKSCFIGFAMEMNHRLCCSCWFCCYSSCWRIQERCIAEQRMTNYLMAAGDAVVVGSSASLHGSRWETAGFLFLLFVTAASSVLICIYEQGTYEEQRCAVVGYRFEFTSTTKFPNLRLTHNIDFNVLNLSMWGARYFIFYDR